MTPGSDQTGPPRYAVTACVLLARGPTWLLSVRSAGVGHAAGRIGLIGGHVEAAEPGTGVLEATGRRELAEETGLDLTAVTLLYLESAYLVTDDGEPQITVTFVGRAPDGEPTLAAPAELAQVDWWDRAAAAADPRCPDWLPGLLDRARRRLGA